MTCNHEWIIWPETDGGQQKCGRCGSFRATPPEDKFWLPKQKTSNIEGPVMKFEVDVKDISDKALATLLANAEKRQAEAEKVFSAARANLEAATSIFDVSSEQWMTLRNEYVRRQKNQPIETTFDRSRL